MVWRIAPYCTNILYQVIASAKDNLACGTLGGWIADREAPDCMKLCSIHEIRIYISRNKWVGESAEVSISTSWKASFCIPLWTALDRGSEENEQDTWAT